MLVLIPPLPPRTAPTNPVVYEVNLRAFGMRPDGRGDGFAAVTRRVPAIRRLGVNVLWLMPVQPVGRLRSAGGLGSPYAVADYDRLNPEFGDERTFRALVATAHASGTRVILDWVGNHTAWDHPWIKAHPEWYTHDAKGNIATPAGTNWQDVADLDFAQRPMRRAMIASMRGWISRYGIDGFRCDAADMVPIDFWREAIAELRRASGRPLLFLAEGTKANYAAGFDLIYGWDSAYRLREAFAGKSARPVVPAIQAELAAAPRGKAPLRFSTNHDWSAWEAGALELYRTPTGARTAAVVATLTGGATLVYTGQEVAWTPRIPIFERSSIDWSRDPVTGRWLTSLLNLRRAHPALGTGGIVDLSTDDLVALRRQSDGEQALILANVRGSERTLLVDGVAGIWRDGMTGVKVTVGRNVSVPAYGSRVLLRAVPGKPKSH